MGAWGYGSFENDSALDFVGSLINEKAIKDLFKSKNKYAHNYDEMRITAEILIHLHKIHDLWIEQETIDGLILGLEKCVADDEWFESWRDERDAKLLKKQIKKFIKNLQSITGY